MEIWENLKCLEEKLINIFIIYLYIYLCLIKFYWKGEMEGKQLVIDGELLQVIATRNTRDRSNRLENMCWRIWHLARKKKQVRENKWNSKSGFIKFIRIHANLSLILSSWVLLPRLHVTFVKGREVAINGKMTPVLRLSLT